MTKFSISGERIVVGVDGSPGSVRALRWAAAEARLRGLPLHVVSAYHWEVFGMAAAAVVDPHDDVVVMQREALAEAADDLRGLDVHADIVVGFPADVLDAAARDAVLLVVGSRGHGGLTRMVLGSVSHAVVQHAACPVVVVHEPREEVPEGAAAGVTGSEVPPPRERSDAISAPLL